MLDEGMVKVANFAVRDIRKIWFEELDPVHIEVGESLLRDLSNSMFSRGATIEQVIQILENNGFDMEYRVFDVDDDTMKRLKKGLI
ncbi:hypothetical protein [Bacillus sp. CH_203]|uniref:hypothetical protein n=1 Tax=Bacillus sp. CH_203 TaxID=2978216 RepID=UPI0030FA4AA3|nr:hypothetical protein [Bacillus cereus]